MARNLRLFYLFRLLATSYLWIPVFFFFMTSRGLDFDQILMLAAVYSVVVILVEIPTGALADRIGRRQSMMAGALALMASCLVAYFADSFGEFVIAEILSAVSMSLCSGADSAYLYDMLHASGRTGEYARLEAKSSAWHLAGNAAAFLAGGLLGTIDLSLPYMVTAITGGIAFFVALALGDDGHLREVPMPRRRSVKVELGSYLQLMGRALADVRRNRRLIWIVLYSGVAWVLLRATHYLYQPYLKQIGFDIAETGVIFAGTYLVAAVVAYYLDELRRWLGESLLVWGLLAGLAASFLLLNQFAGPWWALSMLAVQASAKGLFSPLVKPILNRQITSSSRRATVLSVESIARRGATGIFLPIIGLYGLSAAIYLCGALGLVGFVALAIWGRYSPATEPAEAPLSEDVVDRVAS